MAYTFKYYTQYIQAKQYAICNIFSCQDSIRKKIVVSGFFTVTVSSENKLTPYSYSFLRPALNKTYIHKHTHTHPKPFWPNFLSLVLHAFFFALFSSRKQNKQKNVAIKAKMNIPTLSKQNLLKSNSNDVLVRVNTQFNKGCLCVENLQS